jgi:hypothetical protein
MKAQITTRGILAWMGIIALWIAACLRDPMSISRPFSRADVEGAAVELALMLSFCLPTYYVFRKQKHSYVLSAFIVGVMAVAIRGALIVLASPDP